MPWPGQVEVALREAHALASGAPTPLTSEWLYATWYARPVGPVEELGGWSAPLAGILRAAHAGARSWGSDVETVVDAGLAGVAVLARPDGRRRAATRGEYVTEAGIPGLAPQVGSAMRTLRRRGGLVSDGWWRTWGPAWVDGPSAGPVSRLYLAPALAEVGRLVHAVTTELVDLDVPWAFKVGLEADTLARADGAVVYLPDPVCAEVGAAVIARARPFVRGGALPMAHPIAPGIAWAQDPGDGDSFGEHVCRLLASASPGDGPVAGFLRRAAAAFEEAGIDPATPHRRRTGRAAA